VRVELVQGDITTMRDVDAVVTAANSRLRGGSGVNGAVHAAAGPRLLEASTVLAPCPVGQAVVTPGFDLAPVSWVVHAVGPDARRVGVRPDLLAAAYQAALARADEVGAQSVAFPSISTGVYGYPEDEAAQVSVTAVRAAQTQVELVRLIAYSECSLRLWQAALADDEGVR
jgi:O-acetyl-ADP-ribose deacetylase (regulator of RNase III)